MKLISWNVCGINSTYNKGGLNEVFKLNPDIFCLQEVKNNPQNLNKEIIHKNGYNNFFYPSSKLKGQNGVATYTKYNPITLTHGFNNRFDNEGRIQKIEFEEFNLYNVYFPLGGNKESLKDKFEFYDLFTQYVQKSEKPQIICGDFNRIVAKIDGHDPESLRKTTGFLPEEEQWFKDFLNSGFIDSFRLFNTQPENYTWWTYSRNHRQLNKGYRLDYFLVNEKLKNNITNADILSNIMGSDHAPILLELEF